MDSWVRHGFHGTDHANGEKILVSKEFRWSKGSGQWLGEGIYFFANPTDAEWWCSWGKKFEKSMILKAKICVNLKEHRIIDLVNSRDDQEGMSMFYKEAQIRAETFNRKQHTMNLALSLMLKRRPGQIAVIIAAFDRNRNFSNNYNNSACELALLGLQVQMCVKGKNFIHCIDMHQKEVC